MARRRRQNKEREELIFLLTLFPKLFARMPWWGGLVLIAVVVFTLHLGIPWLASLVGEPAPPQIAGGDPETVGEIPKHVFGSAAHKLAGGIAALTPMLSAPVALLLLGVWGVVRIVEGRRRNSGV